MRNLILMLTIFLYFLSSASDPLRAATDKIEEELKVHPVFGDKE